MDKDEFYERYYYDYMDILEEQHKEGRNNEEDDFDDRVDDSHRINNKT